MFKLFDRRVWIIVSIGLLVNGHVCDFKHAASHTLAKGATDYDGENDVLTDRVNYVKLHEDSLRDDVSQLASRPSKMQNDDQAPRQEEPRSMMKRQRSLSTIHRLTKEVWPRRNAISDGDNAIREFKSPVTIVHNYFKNLELGDGLENIAPRKPIATSCRSGSMFLCTFRSIWMRNPALDNRQHTCARSSLNSVALSNVLPEVDGYRTRKYAPTQIWVTTKMSPTFLGKKPSMSPLQSATPLQQISMDAFRDDKAKRHSSVENVNHTPTNLKQQLKQMDQYEGLKMTCNQGDQKTWDGVEIDSGLKYYIANGDPTNGVKDESNRKEIGLAAAVTISLSELFHRLKSNKNLISDFREELKMNNKESQQKRSNIDQAKRVTKGASAQVGDGSRSLGGDKSQPVFNPTGW